MSRHFESAPGLCENRDPATEGFVFNQTMLRIKNPEPTLDFYTRVMGMTLVKKLDFPAGKFSLYFLAAVDSNALDTWSDDPVERTHQTFRASRTLRRSHFWGILSAAVLQRFPVLQRLAGFLSDSKRQH